MIGGLLRVAVHMVGNDWVDDGVNTQKPPGYLHIFQTQVKVSDTMVNFITSAQDIQLGLGRMNPATQWSLAKLIMSYLATAERDMLTIVYWDREILVTQVGEKVDEVITLHLSPVKVSPGQGGGH